MLIYTKVVEGERVLYGTEGNVPSVDDSPVVYKDVEGQEIADIKAYKLFYGTDKKMQGSETSVPDHATDEVINVFVGDTMVIGTPTEEESEEELGE